MRNTAEVFDSNISRRAVLKIAGGGILAITFLPRLAFAAKCSLTGLRAAPQPNGKTRLVIETTARPSYKISYLAQPDRLVVELSGADGDAKPSISGGCLVKSMATSRNGGALVITAVLKKPIAQIPKENTMVLSPNGDADYRLVLDFAAGTSSGAAAPSAAASSAASTGAVRRAVVVIDAGHGGKDPGCIGKAGVMEKDVVLSVARKLRGKLEAAGFAVYLTRSTDVFLNLDTRAGIAEKKKADLFVSLHANANPSRDVNGFSVYTLSKKASDEEAQKLADAENASDKIDVDGFERFEPEIRGALSALQQHAVAEASVEFAAGAVKSFKSAGVAEQSNAGMRSAPFAVLRSSIPSALVELGHLSNKAEEKLLSAPAYQDKLAATLVKAISSYGFDWE